MTAHAPNLSLGDTGEWVLRLQTRLQALDLFTEAPDGAFGEPTKAAVVQLQERAGLPGDGVAGEQTWAALAVAEEQAGLQDPFAGLPDEGAGSVVDPAMTPVGALSEDPYWRWDGTRWQPRDQVAAADETRDEPSGSYPTADGQWVWDGKRWQSAT